MSQRLPVGPDAQITVPRRSRCIIVEPFTKTVGERVFERVVSPREDLYQVRVWSGESRLELALQEEASARNEYVLKASLDQFPRFDEILADFSIRSEDYLSILGKESCRIQRLSVLRQLAPRRLDVWGNEDWLTTDLAHLHYHGHAKFNSTAPLIFRRAVNASLYPSRPPTPAGTKAPAESFIPSSGMPFSAAM